MAWIFEEEQASGDIMQWSVFDDDGLLVWIDYSDEAPERVKEQMQYIVHCVNEYRRLNEILQKAIAIDFGDDIWIKSKTRTSCHRSPESNR